MGDASKGFETMWVMSIVISVFRTRGVPVLLPVSLLGGTAADITRT